MLLKACLNGARTACEHSALPVTGAALARDAVAVQHVGAVALHVHVKDARGRDTLDADLTAEAVAAIRTVCPLPLGLTTGAWAQPDPGRRVAAVRAWGAAGAVADFASVNWHEDGADDVTRALLDVGMGVEAGIWHEVGARAWLASPLRAECCRVLLELPDRLDGAAADARAAALLDLVQARADRDGVPILLHGEGSSAWPALREAGRRGLATRIGLEDTLLLPDGVRASSNAELVAAARNLLSP